MATKKPATLRCAVIFDIRPLHEVFCPFYNTWQIYNNLAIYFLQDANSKLGSIFSI